MSNLPSLRGGFVTDETKRFLALSVLLLMDLDIQAASGFKAEMMVGFRNSYASEIRRFAIPDEFSTLETRFSRDLVELLHRVGSRIDDFADVASVGTELVLLDPWKSAPGLLNHEVPDAIRRLALKEILRAVQQANAEQWADALLGVQLDDALRKIEPFQKKPRKWLYAALGGAIGGFVLAPHLGAAIGASMGMAGAAGTSAGLALLGGGSVASGGLGMLGGTYLVAAASSAVGLGAGVVSARMAESQMNPDVEAVKLSMTVDSFRRYGREDLVDLVRTGLDRRVRDLASERLMENSKSNVDTFQIQKIDREAGLINAVVPKILDANANASSDS